MWTGLARRFGGRSGAGADAAWVPGTVLTVVAHPDDDLYFLNPGISVAIGARVPVVGIVVAAAQGDGRNVDTNDPDRAQAPVDYAGYQTARQVGLRRAYARMAGLPAASEWRRDLVTLRSGLAVERATLTDRPEVVLYFFNVAQADIDGQRRTTLPPLMDGTLDRGVASPAVDGLTPEQPVTRTMLVESLVELIERYRPAVLRTLDPDPEHDWGIEDRVVVSDHLEHTATALLAIEAVHRVSRRRETPPVVEYYRGYANRYWPTNLSPGVYQEKADYLRTYAGSDGEPDPGLPYGHGDYQLGKDPYRSSHIYSTAQRYAATAGWLTALESGGLAAFAVLGDRLAVWSERKPGSGRWRGPSLGTVSGLMPTLAVAAGARGPAYVVALRRADGGSAADLEIGYCTVDPEARLSGWQSLGNPEGAHPDRRRQREVGVPAATVDGDGQLWVFVRDFTGGLSARRQVDGEWQPWEPLGGPLLQDTPVARTTEDGLVQVYAPGKTTTWHWRQAKPGGPVEPDGTLKTGPVASGGLRVVHTAGDRACLLFREGTRVREGDGQEQTSRIRAYREHAKAGTWPGGPADFGGPDGLGPVAALGRRDAGAGELVMAQRNGSWTVSVSVPPAPADGSRWHPLPGMICGAPALATDQAGRGVLAVLGMDGRLHVCRQDEPNPSSPFGGWTTV